MYELVAVGSKYDMFPCEEAVEKFLTDAALASDQDDLNEKKDGVRLMTVHASKGLEFDYVFISGLEEDLFPHGRPDGGKKNVEESEEERRLFYVAITRARKKLFLTYASIRSMFGNRMINAPSSFIEDLTPEILESEFGETDNYHGKVIYLED
jgi:DNA helicase-2/ATP-dependent DNA helicase PcrA